MSRFWSTAGSPVCFRSSSCTAPCCPSILATLQIRALVREVRKTTAGDMPVEVLLPFMSPRRAAAGDVLFHRGDNALEMYYLLSGAIRLQELDKTLAPGAMLGEISLFAPRRERTATAICDTDVELLAITADKVMQLSTRTRGSAFMSSA